MLQIEGAMYIITSSGNHLHTSGRGRVSQRNLYLREPQQKNNLNDSVTEFQQTNMDITQIKAGFEEQAPNSTKYPWESLVLGIPAGARRNGKSPNGVGWEPHGSWLRSWVKRLIAKVNERLKFINYPVYIVYLFRCDEWLGNL